MKDQTFDQLVRLKELGLDAMEIFNFAIQKMSNSKIKNKLEEYNREHREHVESLSRLIKNLPQDQKEEGFSEEDFPKDSIASEACALLNSAQSDEHILKSLFQLEEVIHDRYIDTLKELGANVEVSKHLNHNLAREQWHLAYVREALAHPEFFQEGPAPSL